MKKPEEIKKGLVEAVAEMFWATKDGDDNDMRRACGMAHTSMADALAYIQQLEARVPRWIPVEERLPEELTDVLTKCGHGAAWFYGLAHLFEGKWKVDGIGGSVDIVTHWMPLPEPPEEGAN